MAKILVVDDDPDFVDITRMILEKHDYDVMTAASGAEALAAMRREKPDLLLLDVMMSTTLEGVDISKEMEADPNLSDVPIVMISSITTSEYASEFPDNERIPIDAWISKPIQPEVLLRTVERFLG